MKPRSLLILLLVVLALGGFLWFVERDLPGTEEREERANRVLPGLEAEVESDAVTALILESKGEGETVRLERKRQGEEEGEGSVWHITAPQRFAGARADGAAVEDLLSALAGLTRERTLDDVTPAEVGLAEPRARVVLERDDAPAVTLAVGGEVPASGNMVVRRQEADGAGEVMVVSRAIYSDLQRDAGDWRSRDLFPAARRQVERVALRGRGVGEAVVLARRDDGAGDGFDVVEPLSDRADRPAVDSLLAALTGLIAERFLDAVTPEELAGLGLDPPRGTVRVATAKGGAPFVVEVGAPTATDSLHLRVTEGDGPGRVVTARTALLEALERPAADWASRSLTERRIFEIRRLAVDGPDGAFVLERSSPDWLRDGERIPYTPVSDLLYALTDARADRTVPRAGLRLGAPQLTFTLTAEVGEGTVEETLALHPAGDAGKVPATVSGRDRVLLLPTEAVTPIRQGVAAVRDAEPLPEEGEAGEGAETGLEIEVEEGPGS